ncbi:TPA: transglutaminase domain-containing protein [Streptococcus suis]
MKDYLSTRKLAVLVLLSFSLSSLTACSTNQVEEKLQELQASFSQEKKELESELRQLEKEVAGNFYFQQLDTDKERRVYLQFVNGLRKRENTIELASVNQELYTRVYFSVANDFPEYYWLTDAMVDGIEFSDLSQPIYPADVEQVSLQLEEVARAILEQAPKGSDYEIVKFFYETIIKQTDYDVEALSNDSLSWKEQGITSVLLEKKSVCAGYSRTFQYLCKLAGIHCIYVSGMANSEQGGQIGHAWNLVQIGGQYYGIDTTWGDPVFEEAMGGQGQAEISYDYLCVTDEALNRTRKADSDLLGYWGQEFPFQSRPLVYPSATDNSLNYYVQLGAYFTTFDETAVLDSVRSQKEQGADRIFLQFSNQEALQEMVDMAGSDNNALFYALGDIYTYQYFYNDQTYTFEVTGW